MDLRREDGGVEGHWLPLVAMEKYSQLCGRRPIHYSLVYHVDSRELYQREWHIEIGVGEDGGSAGTVCIGAV